MALGPREKSDLELHWRHQQDYVRSDLRDIYRRMQNIAEREAFDLIVDHYQKTGELLDLRADRDALVNIAHQALPKGE